MTPREPAARAARRWSPSAASGWASSAHASVPDLKESVGGLRDATVLKALVATWLVDVPHADLEPARLQLLDVRDVLHEVAGRATDRIAPEAVADLAAGLGLPDAESRPAAGARARPADHPPVPADLAARRRRAGAPAAPPAPRAPELERVAPGVAVSPRRGGARPGRPARRGPAAAAARRRRGGRAEAGAGPADRGPAGPRGRPGSRSPGPPRPATCSPGCWPPGRGCSPSGRPSTRPVRWSGSCPSGSGSGCCRTPRSCTGSPSTGTWSRPASRPRALIRRVARPDVLMVAALLHDIGKGSSPSTRWRGSRSPRRSPRRMGFDEREVDLVGGAGALAPAARRGTATTRDLEDPATVGVRRRADPRPRDARPARGAHRGGRPGHLAEGVDLVAGRAGRRPGAPGPPPSSTPARPS